MKLWMRAFLLALPLALAVLFVCSALLLMQSHDDMMDRENARAWGEQAMLGGALATHMETVGEQFSADEALQQQAVAAAARNYARHYTGLDVALAVAAADGEVLYTGMTDAQQQAMALEPAVDERQSVTRMVDGQLLLFVSGWINVDEMVYRVDLMHDITAVADALREYAWRAAMLMLGASAVLGVGLYALLSAATRPLGLLARRVGRVGQGDYVSAFPSGSGEVGQLSSAFERMSGEVRQRVEELEQAKADREVFIANLAHEMKTPMTTIIGYSDLMLRANLTEDQQLRALNAIHSEGQRLDSLSKKLLRLFKIESGQALQPVEMEAEALLDGVAEAMSLRMAQKGVALDVRCEQGKLRVDPDLMAALLMNLTENALRASPDGGRVELGYDGESLYVRDQGAGIPAQELERVKQPFYSLDKQRSGGGTGLGLSLCDAIARAHGGGLTLVCGARGGTTARVKLDKSFTTPSSFGETGAV